jgi:hypothetical protein
MLDVTNRLPMRNETNADKSVKTLIKAIRSESEKFLDRDFIQEYNQSTQNKPMGAQSPTLNFLCSLEGDLKIINSHMNYTDRIGKEYTKLLNNQRKLDNTVHNIQKQIILKTLYDAQKPIDTDSTPNASVKLMAPLMKTYAIPIGNIHSSYQHNPPKPPAIFEISNPSPTCRPKASPDIFSAPKTGSNATYKIIPFDLIAGA